MGKQRFCTGCSEWADGCALLHGAEIRERWAVGVCVNARCILEHCLVSDEGTLLSLYRVFVCEGCLWARSWAICMFGEDGK